MNKTETHLIVGIQEDIIRAENRRILASEIGDDDKTYLDALSIVSGASGITNYLALSPIINDRITAGICQLNLIGTTINLDRANYTKQNRENKIDLLEEADHYLLKAKPLGEKLADRGYWRAINGEPFIWTAEISLREARIIKSYPESGKEGLIKAEGHFRQAKEIGLDIYNNEGLFKDVRGAGVLAAAVSRVEELSVRQKLAEEYNHPLPELGYNNEICLTWGEIDLANHLGYNDSERNKTISNLIDQIRQ